MKAALDYYDEFLVEAHKQYDGGSDTVEYALFLACVELTRRDKKENE
jgi:hypothetical protein